MNARTELTPSQILALIDYKIRDAEDRVRRSSESSVTDTDESRAGWLAAAEYRAGWSAAASALRELSEDLTSGWPLPRAVREA